jgi:hypothetical protein
LFFLEWTPYGWTLFGLTLALCAQAFVVWLAGSRRERRVDFPLLFAMLLLFAQDWRALVFAASAGIYDPPAVLLELLLSFLLLWIFLRKQPEKTDAP